MESFEDSNNSDFEDDYDRSSDDQNDHVKGEMFDNLRSDSSLRSPSRSVSPVYKRNYKSLSEDSESERSHSIKFKSPGFSQSKPDYDSPDSIKKKSSAVVARAKVVYHEEKCHGEHAQDRLKWIQRSEQQEHRDLGFHLQKSDATSSNQCSSLSPEIHKRKYKDLSKDDDEEEMHSKKKKYMLQSFVSERSGDTSPEIYKKRFKSSSPDCPSEMSYDGRPKMSDFSKLEQDYDPSQSMAKCSNVRRKGSNVSERVTNKMGYQERKGRGKHSQERLETMQDIEQQEHRGPVLHLPGLDSTSINERSNSASPDISSEDDDSDESHDSRFKEEGYTMPSFDSQRSEDAPPKTFKRKYEQNYDLAQSTRQHSAPKKTSNIAANIMKKMGYQEGKGLGKHAQGRVDPVQAAKQRGHRGFGLHLPGLEDASIKWDPQDEEIKVREDIEWITNTDYHVPTLEELEKWIVMGPAKETIDDETTFCSPETVKNVIGSKTVFDNLDKVEMYRARTRSNPFETIRGAFFLNRAAVKMANMDKACDFMFTNPKGLKSNELLYFADVCAGPGGFSEYVLWRKKWRAKGFGFTLKNENDFKLDDFYAGPCETFHPFYGPKENGDVFDPDNQDAFYNLVMKHTNNVGVHFMMSDGGFSVSGQENIQEILSKQLYLCQCLVALMIVRPGGHFVTKLFDIFTPFSAGLVYLMYRCFDEISIFKPNTSRPANSERYLICKGKRENTYDVMQYLRHINLLLHERNENSDVMQIVPLEELETEGQFLQYLRTSNDILGKKQITGLLKIAAYCQDTTLTETRQANMRKECLEYWELPDKSRVAPSRGNPQERLRSILNISVDFLSVPPKKLTLDNVDSTVMDLPYDWFCVPSSTGPYTDENKMATFYMSMGRTKVYRYTRNGWTQVETKLELPPDTLVYAEITQEAYKEGRHQRKNFALHILDAYVLGGEDISKRYITDRHNLTKLFCEALWKPNGSDYARIRVKELHAVDHKLDEKLRVKPRLMKNCNAMALTYEFEKMPFEDDGEQGNSAEYPLFFKLNSVLFLKSTSLPWSRHYSRKNNLTYVFDRKTKRALFDKDRPREAEASFIETFKNRFIWCWPDDKILTMEAVVQKIREKCPHVSEQS